MVIFHSYVSLPEGNDSQFIRRANSQVRTGGDAAHGVAGSSWGPPNAAMKKSCDILFTMSLIYINNTDS